MVGDQTSDAYGELRESTILLTRKSAQGLVSQYVVRCESGTLADKWQR